VYPWHRDGSLNNTKYGSFKTNKDADIDNSYKTAKLSKKKESTLRYSYKTIFLDSDKIWTAEKTDDEDNFPGISGVSIFNSDEVSLVRIPSPKNSGLPDINYYGNIDKILNVTRVGEKADGYPIVVAGTDSEYNNSHDIFTANFSRLTDKRVDNKTYVGVDPVSIKYKSNIHAVMALNYSVSQDTDKEVNYKQKVLPGLTESFVDNTGASQIAVINSNNYSRLSVDPFTGVSRASLHPFWDKNNIWYGTKQDIINISDLTKYPYYQGNTSTSNSSYKGLNSGWLWLGELYRDVNTDTIFGGTTEEAIANNKWLPCGKPVLLTDCINSIVNNGEYHLLYTEGDTYYQRYDNIKTYPFTLEDQNSIVDIGSFMCETRVNIDGRYDRNRGQTSNLVVTPENFNQVNDVYSQKDDFFVYRALDANKLNLNNFHNSITWTKTKISGDLIDTWTNLTLASTLDLDGDKGSVNALRRFGNEIISFQDTGISQILYNENIQVSSNNGVPIEIANSGKVQGKRYLEEKAGCHNKWSICETPTGIFFIDDITKDICLFNGKLESISDKYGFHSWINSRSDNVDIWNPIDFTNIITYYDKVNGDVFFVSADECLAFSETFGQFTSFYSYEHTPYFANIHDRGVSFNTYKDTSSDSAYHAWLHNEGDYNIFFNKFNSFYTTVVVNPDMQYDKIFDTVDFRADSWDSNNKLLDTTFNKLHVKNEYQDGVSDLTTIGVRGAFSSIYIPSSLKRKFRVWRAKIPRSSTTETGRIQDRIRNPWIYLSLIMDRENRDKTILYDMMVHYFE
jgi:hypothetical protein